MIKVLFFSFILMMGDCTFGDNNEESLPVAQIPATFPGGDKEWRIYLQNNLDPSSVLEKMKLPAGIIVKEAAIVSFTIDKDGDVIEVKCENKQSINKFIAEEALRVVRDSPRWNPAKQKGKFVKYRQKQSITFEIGEE